MRPTPGFYTGSRSEADDGLSGKRAGNSIDFVFDYTDGPFHNTFSWDPAKSTWTFLIQAERKDGTWQFFAEDTVRRK